MRSRPGKEAVRVLAAKVILMLLVSVTASLGNSLLKAGASGGREEELLELRHLPRAFLRPAIIGGVFTYGISQLLWITVLRVVDLSLAYPLQIGLNFVLIMLIAWWYFKEPLKPGRLVGIALIFAGILMVASG
ncbi:MAG: SMR family transporter [Actinobacteria bacterium]|nr:SMR family transporter [Actinomycetota bacterium]